MFASPSACHSASAYQISSKSDHSRQSYDVISFFQDGSQGIAILFPISVFVISLIWEGRNLPAYQISTRYLNPRLRYNNFRFLKTNVRHFGILLPVSIFTFALPLACHFISAYQISCKSDNLRRSYDVIFIFKDDGLLNFFKVTADHTRSANRSLISTRSDLQFRR